MAWELEEAVGYYKKQGAPGDQSVLMALLREVQLENGGRIPREMVFQAASSMGVKESFLLALIRRIPSLHLADTHCLEVCAGPNCGRHTVLAGLAENMASEKVTVKFMPCMRMCGKGPNIRWDGKIYHQADEALLRRLMQE